MLGPNLRTNKKMRVPPGPCTSPWKVRMTARHYKMIWICCLHGRPGGILSLTLKVSSCTCDGLQKDYILYGQILESAPCARYLRRAGGRANR